MQEIKGDMIDINYLIKSIISYKLINFKIAAASIRTAYQIELVT